MSSPKLASAELIRSARDALAGTISHHLDRHGMRQVDPERPAPHGLVQLLDFGGGNLAATLAIPGGEMATFSIKIRQQKD